MQETADLTMPAFVVQAIPHYASLVATPGPTKCCVTQTAAIADHMGIKQIRPGAGYAANNHANTSETIRNYGSAPLSGTHGNIGLAPRIVMNVSFTYSYQADDAGGSHGRACIFETGGNDAALHAFSVPALHAACCIKDTGHAFHAPAAPAYKRR